MNPSTAAARPRPQVEVESHRPSLRLVAARPLSAARLPFAIFVGAILVTGLVTLLLLHTMAAQDAFRLASLEQQSSALDDTEEQLAVANEQAAAPSVLGAHARTLGMVPTGSIAYVELHHHGRIVGVVQAAPPPPPPPAPSPSPSPTASAAAKKTAERQAATNTPAKHHAPNKHPARHQPTHHHG
jgi:hypothetical protein